MAPYNHFDDRAALVAAVGAHGFRKLAREIRESAEQVAGRPARQLQEAGITYVRFAVANPQLFRLMFSPELADKRAHPDLATAAQQTFGVLEDLVEQSAGTDARAQQGAMGPLVAWSLVHGLAVLLLDQQLGPPVDLQVAEQIARGATEAIWVGLAATTRERKSQP